MEITTESNTINVTPSLIDFIYKQCQNGKKIDVTTVEGRNAMSAEFDSFLASKETSIDNN